MATTEFPSAFPTGLLSSTPTGVPSNIPSHFPTTVSPTNGPKQVSRLFFNLENNLTNQILIISVAFGIFFLCGLTMAVCWFRRNSNSASARTRNVEAEWSDNVSKQSLLSGGRETPSKGYAYEKHLQDTHTLRHGFKSKKNGSSDDYMQRLV